MPKEEYSDIEQVGKQRKSGRSVEEEAHEMGKGGVGDAVCSPRAVVVHFGDASVTLLDIELTDEVTRNMIIIQSRAYLMVLKGGNYLAFCTLCNDEHVAASQHHISDTIS